MLGVCLGHQALAHVAGGAIDHAPEVMHGRLSAIHHDGRGLFAGIPQGFAAVRYHSLVVGALPPSLRVTAWTPDAVVMGLEHRVATAVGRPVPSRVDLHRARARPCCATSATSHASGGARTARAPRAAGRPAAGMRVHHRTLATWCDPEAAFVALYGAREHAVWLDSSRVERGRARFSFMGAPEGPLGQVVRYDVAAGLLTVDRAGGTRSCARASWTTASASSRACAPTPPTCRSTSPAASPATSATSSRPSCGGSARAPLPLPDAALLLCDRLIAFDHEERRVHCSRSPMARAPREAGAWLAATEREPEALALRPPPAAPAPQGPLSFVAREDRDAYLADIAACQHQIFEGETYEVCLTTELRSDGAIDPLGAYRALRARNPAPYAAFLRLGDVAVLSSSPERFLRVDRGRVESKPIKGTAARGAHPAEDAYRGRGAAGRREVARREPHDRRPRAQRSRPRLRAGQRRGAGLMAIESYATVHQLVTTIRGRLRDDATAIDCIRAAFPGGSMTGAPKLRTMGIIDRLEAGPRGVYSGALGFLSVNGAADLSIVIRTLVASRTACRSGRAARSSRPPIRTPSTTRCS